ncbi:MAG: TatD family hydrolase [Bacteroidetes bacterium]|nr:TatD family hydrolase [Bacteroidota bacterium]
MIIDTHTHLFNPEFDNDRVEVIERAFKNRVKYMLLPNVDVETIDRLKENAKLYPENCLPLMGIHPCSVNENYKSSLDVIEMELFSNNYFGVGEIGLDLYWDKTFKEEQAEAFITQLKWARQLNLATSMHTRDATYWAIDLIKKEKLEGLKGVFHCFTGSLEEANEIIKLGFSLGIGGVVTYKNTNLRETLKNIPIEHIVLETDAPYLSPVPYRGKRNEPSYLKEVVQVLSEVYQCSVGEIEKQTSENAINIFGLKDLILKNS